MTHISQLKDISQIQVGYQTKGRVQENIEGTHALIQGSDFDGCHALKAKTLLSFNPKRDPEPYLVKRGDVLFQARGLDNIAIYLEHSLQKTLAASTFYVVRIKDREVLPQYATWWLNQKTAQNYFKSQASGTRMSFISKKTLANMSIPIPPIRIQEKIIRASSLLAAERNLCAELAELRGKLVESICTQAVQK